jgi:Acetyltransferase (GNAT) domain
MADRIASAACTHAWVVLEDEGRVVGYAYGGPFKSRAAYRWSCEVSVYLERNRRRTGGGRALYEALCARPAKRGYRTAVAGMTLPNEASVGLHRAMGFRLVGIYRVSAGSTAAGTTSPGSSGPSPPARNRPPSHDEVLAQALERLPGDAGAPAIPMLSLPASYIAGGFAWASRRCAQANRPNR